ncbi:hypothetical protein [Streptomyces sp. CAU 1734]|uniref:hypothetical protein n=1 Tax=Streptomyces sp. CAU 1734 TaxID=3140360 RepID=UPI0032605F41
MTTASFTPASEIPRPRGRHGAGAPADGGAAHGVGGALRAVRVFAAAIFSVTVLGEYGEEVGVRR